MKNLQKQLIEERKNVQNAEKEVQRYFSEMGSSRREWEEKITFLSEVEQNYEYLKTQIQEYEKTVNIQDNVTKRIEEEKNEVMSECKGLREQLKISRSNHV